jgi:hypothetical protein
MGIVACPKHGRQGGPLCCVHVLDAVGGRSSSVVRYGSLKCEALGCVVHFRICDVCATKHGLLHQNEVAEAIFFDEQRFPWVAPVCSDCLSAYELTQ